MKIVLFPGVGFNTSHKHYRKFLDEITSALNCEGEVFLWQHSNQNPEVNLPYKCIRSFVQEVILDFQQIVCHANEMEVPQADIYIGHSAGSILALIQNKPCVTFASPASLIEIIDQKKVKTEFLNILEKNNMPILNIVNQYDVIGMPINKTNVENYVYKGKWCNPFTYSPINAHIDYWVSKKVIRKIIKTLKKW